VSSWHVYEIKQVCLHYSILWAQFSPRPTKLEIGTNHQCWNLLLLNMWCQAIMLATRVLQLPRYDMMLAQGVARYVQVDEQLLQSPFRPLA
jgi:hypothetical protein